MFNNAMALELMSKDPIPIPIQHAMPYAGILIMLISGIAMLKGQNWARLLYVIWSVIGFLIGIATSSMKVALIPSFVLFLVVAFFLFHSVFDGIHQCTRRNRCETIYFDHFFYSSDHYPFNWFCNKQLSELEKRYWYCSSFCHWINNM